MNRYRTLANEKPTDFSNYYSRKNGFVEYKYALNHCPCINNNKKDVNFTMTNSVYYNGKKNIINYRSYDTLISLSKTSAILTPSCNDCPDTPLTLLNGATSSINYDDLYEHEICEKKTKPNCDCCCIKCKKTLIINICHEQTGKLFPYGKFNNATKNPNIQIHSLQNVGSCDINFNCNPVVPECCINLLEKPVACDKKITYIENIEQQCKTNYAVLPEYMKNNQDYLEKIKIEDNNKNKELSENCIEIYSRVGNNKSII